MKNLKISQKIAVLLGVLILLTVAISVKSMFSLAKVNHQSTIIVENWLPSITELADIDKYVNAYRRAELRYAIQGEASEGGKQALSAMSKASDKLEENFKIYEKLISSEEERKNFDLVKSNWALYQQKHAQFLEQSRVGHIEEANAFLMGEMKSLYDKIIAPLEENIVMNDKGAQEASHTGDKIYAQEKIFAITSIIVLLVLAVSIVWLLSRNVASPIKSLKDYMGVLQAGDYTQEVPMTARKDEIGQMAGSIQNFKESLIANREMEAQQRAEDQRKLERQARVDVLVKNFDAAASSAVTTVAAAATELSQTASSMGDTATKSSQQAGSVASASQQTAGTVQSVAAAAEEMSASVQEISKQVANSVNIVREAMEEAKNADTTSRAMLDASQSINAVTQIISGIAGQINLLALNATIESARAGEAGKGFAVVASEVKTLATQTSKATDDIRQQLEGLQVMASNVADALVRLTGSVGKVNEVSNAIAAAVEEQTAVTQEIVSNMNVASSGVTEINRNIDGIRKSTEETTMATKEILGASDELSQQAESLNHQVRDFLSAIKTA